MRRPHDHALAGATPFLLLAVATTALSVRRARRRGLRWRAGVTPLALGTALLGVTVFVAVVVLSAGGAGCGCPGG
ncbi:hypothetical protein ABH931_006584 [Streptacidiphilus sp. MAP12-33]|uniref:hypothetical protein n=1 Tax=Streptacidiphilus sp. MAP12-33 TaxID=3156266 RepID=UPI003510E8BD